MNKLKTKLAFLISTILFTAQNAFAAGAGLPWESPLDQFLTSAQGPVAKSLGAIIIIGTGLTVASGEGGAGVRKLVWVAFGLTTTFAAVTFFLGFFGFGNGLTF